MNRGHMSKYALTVRKATKVAGKKNTKRRAPRLAIDGGVPAVIDRLPPWPAFDEPAIKAVEEVLRSGKVNYWTGRKGMEFEKKFAAWQGSGYAVSVATGTAALHVGLTALGIGPGDEVIVPSYTFIASSFSIVQAGAIPRFADVNLEDHCLSVASAEKLVNDAHQSYHAGSPVRQRVRHGRDQGLREAAQAVGH